MSKIINHNFNGSNGIHLLQRKYLGKGRYYQRCLAKGAQVGDTFKSHTSQYELVIDKIISVSDSKAQLLDDEQQKDALIEMELIHPYFTSETEFVNKPCNFGN